MAETWRRCPDCDVQWHSAELLCFECGEPSIEASAPPLDTSLYAPISEKAWREVRRQIGVD